MNANFKMKLITATLMMLGSVYAQASLSALSVNSNLGEPFSGSVVVSGPSAQEILANKSAVSVDDSRIQVSVVAQGKNAVVRFRSKAPINDPIFNLRLKASSESRTYTALLDPRGGQSGRKAQDNQQETGKARPSSHVVASGQTIHDIARLYQPKGMSLQQTTNALVRANPKAFKNGNPDTVFAGARLSIPSPSQMRALSAPVRSSQGKVPTTVADTATDKENGTVATVDEKNTNKIIEPQTNAASEKEPVKDTTASEEATLVASDNVASDNEAASAEEASAAAAEKAARLAKLKAEQEAAQQALLAEEEFDWMAYAPFIGGGVVLLLLVAILLRRRKNTSHDDFDDDDDLPPTPKPTKGKKAVEPIADDGEDTAEKPVKKGLFSGLSLSRKKKAVEEDDDFDLAVDDEIFDDISFETPVVTPEQKMAQREAAPAVEAGVVDQGSASAHDLGALLKANQNPKKAESSQENVDLPSFDDLADFAIPTAASATKVVQQPTAVLDEIDLDLDALDFGGLKGSTPSSTATSIPTPPPVAAAPITNAQQLDVNDINLDLDALDFGGLKSTSTLSTAASIPTSPVAAAPIEKTKSLDVGDLNLDALDFDGLNAKTPLTAPASQEPIDAIQSTPSMASVNHVEKKASAFAKIGQNSEYKLDFDDSLSFDLTDLNLGEGLVAPEVVEPIFVDERPKENVLAPSPLFDKTVEIQSAEPMLNSDFDLNIFEEDAPKVAATSAPVMASTVENGLAFDVSMDDLDITKPATAEVKTPTQPVVVAAEDSLAFDVSMDDLDIIKPAVAEVKTPTQPVVVAAEDSLAFDVSMDDLDIMKPAVAEVKTPEQPVVVAAEDSLAFNIDDGFALDNTTQVDQAVVETTSADEDFTFDDFNLDQAFTEQVDTPAPTAPVVDDFDLALDAHLDNSSHQVVESVSPEVVQESNAIALAAKLDLVETYLEMGDTDGAREALSEILDEAKDAKILDKAKALQSRLG